MKLDPKTQLEIVRNSRLLNYMLSSPEFVGLSPEDKDKLKPILTTKALELFYPEFIKYLKKYFKPETVQKVKQKVDLYIKASLKKPSKEEKDFIETSFIEKDNIIYEQVKENQYIDSTGKFYTEVYNDNVKHIPHSGDELKLDIVLLPEFPEDYGDINKLTTEIYNHIYKYYDSNEQTIRFAVWYVLLSWVYDRLNTINYQRALGDLGTGKSRFLDVVGRICYKPIIGSGAGTVAALKRMVMKWKGTVIVDEGDFKDDDEKGELTKFFNLGIEKQRAIYQCDKNDPNKIDFYIPFCPKIITSRKVFKDKALESRCLTHIARVTNRKDIPIHLSTQYYKEEQVLRNKLLKFRFDYYHKIDSDKVMELDLGEIEPRLKQAMGSFAVLFMNIPKMFDEFKKYLQQYQNELIEERADSFDGQIINAVVDLLLEGNETISSQDIIDQISTEKFQPNVRTIGKHLRGLGLETKQVKIEGKVKRKILFNSGFLDVVKRYVSDKEKGIMVSKVSLHMTTDLPTQKNATLYIKKKSSCDDTHDTHGIMIPLHDTSTTPKIEEEIVEDSDDFFTKFDPNFLVHRACKKCGVVPCNFNQKNEPICEKCWEEDQAKK